jgi:colanic acid/amylovoran biosynthesis glycosyltransferase
VKIAYITAQVPWGRGETFIIDEMLAIKKTETELLIIPRNPTKKVFHQEAQALVSDAVWLPLINIKMISVFLISILTKPRLWKIMSVIFRHSRTWRILVKNLAVLPKGIYIASLLKKKGIEHIHAHWGSTTATMAMVASELTNIPWSFTVHRWDIKENNGLTLKTEKATFVRCISQSGKEEILNIVGDSYKDKIKLIHMGVRIANFSTTQFRNSSHSDFVISCPANLLPVKGHRFLIEACALLLKWGIKKFKCLIIGDGPLQKKIRQQILKYGLQEHVKLLGRLPHNELMELYRRGKIDTVVLPSIVTEDGAKEGIPVSLMEAMAYGIPVISTNTGGIPELITNGAGILVPPASSEMLARAIKQLIKDEKLRFRLSESGYQQVSTNFNIYRNSIELLHLIKRYSNELKAR